MENGEIPLVCRKIPSTIIFKTVNLSDIPTFRINYNSIPIPEYIGILYIIGPTAILNQCIIIILNIVCCYEYIG